MKFPKIGLFILLATAAISAQTAAPPTTNTSTQNEQFEYVHNDITLSPDKVLDASGRIAKIVEVKSGTLSFENAGLLLTQTVCDDKLPSPTVACDLKDPHTYAVINIVRWTDPDSAIPAKQAIASSNWYLYNSSSSTYYLRNFKHWKQADFSGNNRFYGIKKLVVLFVNVNVAKPDAVCPTPYAATYEVDIQKRTPTYLSHLGQLIQLVVPGPGDNRDHTVCPGTSYNLWGGRAFSVGFSTNTTTISSSFIDPTTNQSVALAPNYQIVSEARSYADVSIAVPVKKISAVQYNTVGSTVVPSQINRQNAFAVVDFYLPPIDLIGTNYSFVPHPLLGVSMAQQPLHSVLAAVAAGTHFGEVFVGVDFLKQQSSLKTSRFITKGQLAVGINIPINGAYQSLKKTK